MGDLDPVSVLCLTQHRIDVVATLNQRHDVDSTVIRC